MLFGAVCPPRNIVSVRASPPVAPVVSLARGARHAVARASRRVTPGLPRRVRRQRRAAFAAAVGCGTRTPFARCPCGGRASLRGLRVQHRCVGYSEGWEAACGRSGRSVSLFGPFAPADWRHATQAASAALLWMGGQERGLLGLECWERDAALVAGRASSVRMVSTPSRDMRSS